MFADLYDFIVTKISEPQKRRFTIGNCTRQYYLEDLDKKLMDQSHNAVNVSSNDYLLLIQFGKSLPKDEDDKKFKAVNCTNTDLLDDVVKNKKYLIKLDPQIHRTYQDLVHEFVLGSKKTLVDKDADSKSVYDHFKYSEYKLNGRVTEYHYKGANYWNIDLTPLTN